MKELPFAQKQLDRAEGYLQNNAVKSVEFSEGTYQVEVQVGKRKFWPFLQLSDEGVILDGFCSCPSGEKEQKCAHLAAAYLSICHNVEGPLHVRFRSSLWNQLCWMASRRHGYRTDCLEKATIYQAKSLNGQVLFSVEPLNEEGKKKLEEMVDFRKVETEETSLKFSNLSPEEIQLWKQGKPSEKLKYELSFWADLAKWCLILQESGRHYEITFSSQENKLPQWITLSFDCIKLAFYISKGNWPLIIPALRSMNSPLFVREIAEREIQSIQYLPEKREFHLVFSGLPGEDNTPLLQEEEVEIEGWKFIPDKGFVRLKMDPFFQWDVIPEEKIDQVLTQYTPLLRSYLKEVIFEGQYSLQYHLHLDASHALHIEMFLFEQGDLKASDAAFFGSWVYIPGKGFYSVQKPLFNEVDTVISYGKVGDFVSRHKAWLNHFEGFQIHLVTIEPEMTYQVDENKSLCFFSEMNFTEDLPGVIDFGEWIFISTKGFFSKRKEKMISSLVGGKKIPESDIPKFIRNHKEELSFVPHFFSVNNPVAEFSLEVSIASESTLHVKPIFSLFATYKKKIVLFFQEYCYVEGEGFSKFLLLHPFLEEYALEKTLSFKESMNFLSKFDTLAPWISKIDPQIKVPKKLSLSLQDMSRQKGGKVSRWKLNLQYETEIGLVPAFEVWRALQSQQRYLFSEAGLLDLSSERFEWLKGLAKKKWGGGGKNLSLSAMEWIRLQTMEEISLPTDQNILKTFEEFHSYQSFLPLNTHALKSNLRPYQEVGLKWLWFLYSYSLSGLLCDEMGLGKTHQTMALLAAAFDIDPEEKRFLIICPTSVIYHWEDLLKRFLPSLKVHIFYGQARHSEDLLASKYNVLLTSYGMARSEKKRLKELSFDIAVFDEIQNAKNASSQTHRALASFQAGVKIGLTGTPIENNIMDLKALFDLILPHYLPSDAKFKERFITPFEKTQDKEGKEMLSKIVKPFILRRKKTDVLLELPEKTEEIAYCDLSLEQKELYKELFYTQKKQILEELNSSSSLQPVMHVFALLSKLKQVCNHPCLITKEKKDFLRHKSGKWDLFVELLQEARDSGHKVVIFTQYLEMMDLIEEYLKMHEIGFTEIRGSTKDRRGPLKKFKEDPSCEVFVASLQSAGVGIDLTAGSVVIHYDRWWNPAKEDQATDRVHRMGQSRGVQVFKLVTKKSIEESIHRLILKKKGILDEVVGFDDQNVVKRLTKEEIFELFASLEKDL